MSSRAKCRIKKFEFDYRVKNNFETNILGKISIMEVSRKKWKTDVGAKVSLYTRYTVTNMSWLFILREAAHAVLTSVLHSLALH
jgi:hypothetical protein